MPGLREWVEATTGVPVESLEPLPPGAGRRRYLRVKLGDGGTRVVMHAVPEDPAILPPALEQDDLPFIEVTHFLASHDIPVPEIFAVERENRWLLLEDLGTTHLGDLSGALLMERLREATVLIARVHAIPPTAFPFERAFDQEWIGFELRYFIEHGVPDELRTEANRSIRVLVEYVASLPRAVGLRDYQSQNLMIDPSGRLRVLDYQDALLAPPELDLAALLWDSYLNLESADRDALLHAYEEAAGTRIPSGALAALVLQRKCKDGARLHHLVEVRSDERYRTARTRARRAALEALDRAGADALRGSADALRHALEAIPV